MAKGSGGTGRSGRSEKSGTGGGNNFLTELGKPLTLSQTQSIYDSFISQATSRGDRRDRIAFVKKIDQVFDVRVIRKTGDADGGGSLVDNKGNLWIGAGRYGKGGKQQDWYSSHRYNEKGEIVQQDQKIVKAKYK